MTILTGGFAAPAALAWGGFAAGFSGTLINGGSIGQAFGMGFVGAFAGGVGGLAFNGLQNVARIAALTAIGATAGASSAAIMGGNIGLGAAAGAAAGFLGGAVGGRLADAWKPGLATTAAGIATGAAAGAASAAIAGGDPALGAGLGAFAVATAIAAGKFQTAIDASRLKPGTDHADVAEALARAGFTQTSSNTFGATFGTGGQMDIFGQTFAASPGTGVTVTFFENEIYTVAATQRIYTSVYAKIGFISKEVTVSASNMTVAYNPATRDITLKNSDILPGIARNLAKGQSTHLPED